MKQFAKAIFAGVVAALTALSTVLVDDASLGDLTDGQWVVVVLGALVAAGGVYALPYKGEAGET